MNFTRLAIICTALIVPATLFADSPFTGWKTKHPEKSKWKSGTATMDAKDPAKLSVSNDGSEMINPVGSADLISEHKYGSCTVEIEFMIPKGSNSGVYLMGEYEVQILDTYGKADKDLKPGDMGGIYTYAAPRTNACKKPGEWQKFVIDFDAPKFEGAKKVSNAKFLKVTLNDVVIQENVECKGPTPGGLTGREAATGPLMFQGDHGPVVLRNVKVTGK